MLGEALGNPTGPCVGCGSYTRRSLSGLYPVCNACYLRDYKGLIWLNGGGVATLSQPYECYYCRRLGLASAEGMSYFPECIECPLRYPSRAQRAQAEAMEDSSSSNASVGPTGTPCGSPEAKKARIAP